MMDKLSFLSPAMQKRLKEAEEHKRQILEKRDEYCAVLGIDPKDEHRQKVIELKAYDLETSAMVKPSCNICRWAVFTCKDCEHIPKLYDDYSHKNAFIRCEKYEKYRHMLALKARATSRKVWPGKKVCRTQVRDIQCHHRNQRSL